MNIRFKSTVVALALALIPVVIVAMFAYLVTRHTIRAEVEAHLGDVTATNIRILRDFVRQAGADIGTWADLHVIQDVLIDDQDGDAGRQLERLAEQYPRFAALSALNDAGQVVASSGAAYLGHELSDTDAFARAASGLPYRGAVVHDAVLNRRVIVIAEPIRASYDGDVVIGVLIGYVAWERVAEQLARIPIMGHAQDAEHRLILKERGGEVLYDTSHGTSSPYNALPEAGAVDEIAFGDKNYLVATTSVMPSGEASDEWVLHALMSTERAFAQLVDLRERFLYAALVVAVVAMFIGLRFAHALTAPLRTLESAARHLAEHRFDAPLPPAGDDELGSLTHSFATMRDALRAHELERSSAETRIRDLAYYDQLTGLPNRVFLHEYMERNLALARRHGRALALMYLDLDHFKRINDTLGHNAGDQLLKEASARLREVIRDSDCAARASRSGEVLSREDGRTVARFGGDEFLVVLTDIADATAASRVASRLLDRFSEPFALDSQELFVTTSIGIAVFPADGDDFETLMKNADVAMYDAKQRGRNNLSYYSQTLDARARDRLIIEGELRRAIEDGQFALHYQPQCGAASGAVVGVEALVRWPHPERGLISPAEFILVAEQTGLIVPLGEWVLQSACEDIQAWRGTVLEGLPVSVNLSPRQFGAPDLAPTIARLMDEFNVSAAQLNLEITESVMMENFGAAQENFAALRALGLKLAIDDFGTGYSSLSYLKRLAIDTLKIDRSFVSDVVADANDQAIVTAVISMAHALRLTVVAEGVETEAQAQLLGKLGCDVLQGYLFSRPVPVPELEVWMEALAENRDKTLRFRIDAA